MRINIEISDESAGAVITTGQSGSIVAPTAVQRSEPAIDAGSAPLDALVGVGATTMLSPANTIAASSDGQNAGPAPMIP